jgi:hypothetical protein
MTSAAGLRSVRPSCPIHAWDWNSPVGSLATPISTLLGRPAALSAHCSASAWVKHVAAGTSRLEWHTAQARRSAEKGPAPTEGRRAGTICTRRTTLGHGLVHKTRRMKATRRPVRSRSARSDDGSRANRRRGFRILTASGVTPSASTNDSRADGTETSRQTPSSGPCPLPRCCGAEGGRPA